MGKGINAQSESQTTLKPYSVINRLQDMARCIPVGLGSQVPTTAIEGFIKLLSSPKRNNSGGGFGMRRNKRRVIMMIKIRGP